MLRLKHYLFYIFAICCVVFSLTFVYLSSPIFRSSYARASITSYSIPPSLPELSGMSPVAAISTSIHSQILRNIVRVNNLVSGSSGSGVIIWSGLDKTQLAHTFILTNNHVLPANAIGTIEIFHYLDFRNIESTRAYPARTVLVDTTADLALLEVVSSDPIDNVTTLISLDDYQSMQLYNDIYIVGCGLGRPPFISDAKIISFERTALVANGFSVWGCSGGGVFDSRGRLVSISCRIGMANVNGSNYPITNISLSIPVNIIHDWLLPSKYKFILSSELGSINDIYRVRRYF